MSKDITVVTGFYDIGRGQWGVHPEHGNLARSLETYFGYFTTLAELKNPMVIVTSADLADRVYDIRAGFGLADMTKVIVKAPDRDRLRALQANIANPLFRAYVHDNTIPEFANPGYALVTNEKSRFVMAAIDSGFVQTAQTAWIDFGYCRAPHWFNASRPWVYDFGEWINLWVLRRPDERPIFDVVRRALIYFMGCHIVGPTGLWSRFDAMWQTSFNALLECGFSDDDQTTMLMAWRKDPTLFTLRPGRDHGPNSWYYILREFNDNHAADPPRPLIPPPPSAAVQTTVSPGLIFDAQVLRQSR